MRSARSAGAGEAIGPARRRTTCTSLPRGTKCPRQPGPLRDLIEWRVGKLRGAFRRANDPERSHKVEMVANTATALETVVAFRQNARSGRRAGIPPSA